MTDHVPVIGEVAGLDHGQTERLDQTDDGAKRRAYQPWRPVCEREQGDRTREQHEHDWGEATSTRGCVGHGLILRSTTEGWPKDSVKPG